MRSFLFLLFTFFASLVASTRVALEERADILSPENDPFYKPPHGWKDKEPGTVLRSREVEAALLSVDKVRVRHAFQLLYRTTGTYESDPAVTVTTILVPHHAKHNKLVAHLTYVDADGSKCAFSYAIRKGSDFPGDLALPHQTLIMEQTLEAGYIMTLPDYQGKNRAFAVGPLEGRQTLDGIKATLNFDRLNLKASTPVVTTGYSGGAIASGWAAQLHPTYASSVNAVGFAMGGTPANLTGTLINLDGGLFSGFALAGAAGLAYAYDEMLEWITPRLTKKGKKAFDFARSQCLVPTLLGYPFSKILSEDFFRDGTHLLEVPKIAKIMSRITMGQSKAHTPTAPVYMVHAKHDEVIPYDDALTAGKAWAEHGANVLFHTNTLFFLQHETTELANVPNFLFFVEDRFANKPFVKGFHHKYVRNPLEDPRVLASGLDALVEAIKNTLGDKIGRGDAKIKEALRKHAKHRRYIE